MDSVISSAPLAASSTGPGIGAFATAASGSGPGAGENGAGGNAGSSSEGDSGPACSAKVSGWFSGAGAKSESSASATAIGTSAGSGVPGSGTAIGARWVSAATAGRCRRGRPVESGQAARPSPGLVRRRRSIRRQRGKRCRDDVVRLGVVDRRVGVRGWPRREIAWRDAREGRRRPATRRGPGARAHAQPRRSAAPWWPDGPRPRTRRPVGAPRAGRELQSALVAVAGVDGPVAAGLAPGYLVPFAVAGRARLASQCQTAAADDRTGKSELGDSDRGCRWSAMASSHVALNASARQ